MKSLKEYERYIIYGFLIAVTALFLWSTGTQRLRGSEDFKFTKCEYGKLTTFGDYGYKWQDANKKVFSAEIEDFYEKMGLPKGSLLQDLLNLLGTQGWELVCVSVEGGTQDNPILEHSYYFKRPK